MINGAPGVLDTLKEIADALGNDPNLSATLTNEIASKLSLSGGTMTGALDMGGFAINDVPDPVNAYDPATKNYTDNQVATK